MSKEVEKRIIKIMIGLVALYNAETWSSVKEDIRKLKACEMWV